MSDRGDRRRELAEVVRAHQRHIGAMVRRYVESDEEAGEIAQAAVVQAFERLDDFRGGSSLQTWLSRIAVNLAIDLGRRKKRSLGLDAGKAPVTVPFATGRVSARETVQRLAGLIEELPPRQREVVRLRLLEERAFRDVAASLGCSEEAARVSFHLGMKALRASLASPPLSRGGTNL